MFVLHDPIKTALTDAIYTGISEQFGQEITDLLPKKDIYHSLAKAPNPKMGHIAFACFPLAKILKDSPVNAAKKLESSLPKTNIVAKTLLAGPYLNFFLNISNLAATSIEDVLSGSFFKRKLTQDAPKTMVEFSQPNTHKELHVGHMRNLCLGDSIIKLLRYSNIPTIATTFPGDVGTHVAKCLWYYKKHNSEKPPKERKGAWLGSLYTKGNNLLEDQKGTPQEEINRQELTTILKQLEQKSGEYYDLWNETRNWSVELMQSVYDWANVKFDVWYWESDVDSDSLKFVKQLYDEGKLVKDDGAIGMNLEEEKLGFCLLIKSDGTGLYATKDIELARRKFEEHQVDQNIYVVDNRQAYHFKQVFKVLEKIGFEKAKDCFHLQYEMVELPDGAMSSRKGNIIPIQALIDEMVSKIETDYLNRYRGEWDQAEIDKVANQVAAGAIKYGMTRIDNNKKIVFDMQEWLRLDGESGPYIQYVCARIHSMMNKLTDTFSEKANWSVLEKEIEEQLIFKILDFNNIVETATLHYRTSALTSYLYELAKLYNSFYAECPVATASNNELKVARAKLSQAVAKTLAQGLSLLGIETPTRM